MENIDQKEFLQTKSVNKEDNGDTLENMAVHWIEIETNSERTRNEDRSTILHVSNNTALNIQKDNTSDDNINHKDIQNENDLVNSFSGFAKYNVNN